MKKRLMAITFAALMATSMMGSTVFAATDGGSVAGKTSLADADFDTDYQPQKDEYKIYCTYKNIQDVHTVFKNIGSTASEDDTGLFCQFADCFCLRFIFMIVELFLDIGFIVYRNTQSFGKL